MAVSCEKRVMYSMEGKSNIECRVCNDLFSLQGDKVPRLLHCGHTVCHQCLSRLPLEGQGVLCPFDRLLTDLDSSGIWGLKKNFALIELLEKIQSSTSPQCMLWSQDTSMKDKDFVPCDENEAHRAVVYCMVCSTHLCAECSEASHSSRTLAKHKRVAISEKPLEAPKCLYHPMHFVEFVCLEDGCQNQPLMCYVCKDYGRHVRHQHSLLDIEAEKWRNSIHSALQHMRHFADEILDSSRKVETVIRQLEGSYPLGADTENYPGTVVPGTAEQTRLKVQQYFAELYESLKQQEIAAMAVVDSHIRERLCMLRQQQDDMTLLLSQISAVCHQCDKTMQQDDARVVLAKRELTSQLESLHKQQQFTELRDQIHLDPSIPITFTKDNRVHIGPKMEMRVVILGLDGAGKTSILFKLKQNEFITTIPTIGFNVETVEYKNLKFTLWDVGGQPKLRPLWKHYYLNTQAVIYVIDSSCAERMAEAYNELAKLLQEKELKDASLLVFANKQDIEPSISFEEMTEHLNLFKLCCNRSWHIEPCDARTGAGLADGLEWLSYQLVAAGV